VIISRERSGRRIIYDTPKNPYEIRVFGGIRGGGMGVFDTFRKILWGIDKRPLFVL
jgi:hypothetical protein